MLASAPASSMAVWLLFGGDLFNVKVVVVVSAARFLQEAEKRLRTERFASPSLCLASDTLQTLLAPTSPQYKCLFTHIVFPL